MRSIYPVNRGDTTIGAGGGGAGGNVFVTVIVLFPDESAPRWIDCEFGQVVSRLPDPTAQVYETAWAPPVAVSVTVQSDGTLGGVTRLLPGVVGSPCELKVIVVGLGGTVWMVWAVTLEGVVEELPVAAVPIVQATLTVKVVPGGTAPVTTLFTVRVGSPTWAPLGVLPTRGTPAATTTATSSTQPRGRLNTRIARGSSAPLQASLPQFSVHVSRVSAPPS
jgi:hypothetical protein